MIEIGKQAVLSQVRTINHTCQALRLGNGVGPTAFWTCRD